LVDAQGCGFEVSELEFPPWAVATGNKRLVFSERGPVPSRVSISQYQCSKLSHLWTPLRKVLDLDFIYQQLRRFPGPLVTPLPRLLDGVIPRSLAHRQVMVLASGLVEIGTKPNGCEA
jgi:hypothetical protein